MALHERPSKLTQSEDNDGVAELDELITLREVRANFNKVKVAIKLCPVPGTLNITLTSLSRGATKRWGKYN
jgi:hypothetical protein